LDPTTALFNLRSPPTTFLWSMGITSASTGYQIVPARTASTVLHSHLAPPLASTRHTLSHPAQDKSYLDRLLSIALALHHLFYPRRQTNTW
jgi:hypothetical protein